MPRSSWKPKKQAKGTCLSILQCPELKHNVSSDFWALGCIIYQFIAGRFAFQGLSDFLTWQKIKKLEYSFPEGFDDEARDLIQKLLVRVFSLFQKIAPLFISSHQVREPTERLGVGSQGSDNDIQTLKDHLFFKSINWDKIWVSPPPPLEAGSFKKEHTLPPGNAQIWDDVEAAWDDIMAEDEMAWASDAEDDAYMIPSNGYIPNVTTAKDNELISPIDVPVGAQVRRGTSSTIQGVEEIKQELLKEQTGKQSPLALEDSSTTGTTSSDGSRNVVATAVTSPVKLSELGPSPAQTPTQIMSQNFSPPESERGRNPALSPKQGHAPIEAINL